MVPNAPASAPFQHRKDMATGECTWKEIGITVMPELALLWMRTLFSCYWDKFFAFTLSLVNMGHSNNGDGAYLEPLLCPYNVVQVIIFRKFHWPILTLFGYFITLWPSDLELFFTEFDHWVAQFDFLKSSVCILSNPFRPVYYFLSSSN